MFCITELATIIMNGLAESGFEVALASLQHPGFEFKPANLANQWTIPTLQQLQEKRENQLRKRIRVERDLGQ